ncbi:MAG: hypothetical protein J2P37_08945 [Ktedonobacteraceae bacterium]|nr:hypothetical protein [Ktedonobacteraceae bacterium]
MVLIILAVVVVLGSGSFIAYATVFHGGQNNNPNTTNNGTKNAGKTATPTAGQTTPTPQPGTVPSNTATFQLKVTLTLKADNGQAFKGAVWGRSESEEITLVVAGGKVCQVRDDGRAVSESFDLPTGQLGDKWTYARKFACSGTYADGKLSYTETVTSETLTGQGSLSSTSTADLASKACPYKEYVFDQLDGTFSNATTISGNFSWSGSVVGHCDGQAPVKGSGTWTSKLA